MIEVFYVIYDTQNRKPVMYYHSSEKADAKALELNNGTPYYLPKARYNVCTEAFAD